MEQIRIEGITFSYGKKQVLKRVDMTGEAGQCIGVIGQNGCGKSTLLSILSGIRKPDGGSIAYHGVVMTERKNQKLYSEAVGYVPQENMLLQELTVWDNLMLWYLDKKRLSEELKTGFLQELNLWDMRKMHISELSGGMKKKVSIGCALAGKPQILLLDEPSAALDLPSKDDMRSFLKLFRQKGGSIILSTHEESELALCDKLYIIKDGICEEMNPQIQTECLLKVLRGGENG